MENVEATHTLGLNDISLYGDDQSQATTATLVPNSCNNKGGDLDQHRHPTVRMWFETEDEVKKIYKNYAIRKGFEVRIRTSQKDLDGNISYLKLVCSREGKYVSAIPPEKKTLRTQRKNCPAQMTAFKREGKWCIKTLVDEHSHDISPGKSRLIRGNRIISMHAKRTFDINDEAGVRINKSFRSLVFYAGGYENLEFVERDVRNYLGVKRRALGKNGDGQALLNHFSRMRELNSNFFYEIDLDSEDRIRNIFWADARSRSACHDFGDVVSFDTTYLTNKYDMPFAPFVGINHHGQSILLGCGLLSKEDTTEIVINGNLQNNGSLTVEKKSFKSGPKMNSSAGAVL
ncbi:protein FAR1-RELATED SEQUENCE 5-like [Vigna unguiculata]|uniref:protein FAR1-RELATED SEQUENCE 5-like n=1 Tax=Vigna unguiculata TaxID=3917 RepID=UPI001017028D|nr:protein FAR1-RELATED SEQUENCE 5-like [Vigna unguiculata]